MRATVIMKTTAPEGDWFVAKTIVSVLDCPTEMVDCGMQPTIAVKDAVLQVILVLKATVIVKWTRIVPIQHGKSVSQIVVVTTPCFLWLNIPTTLPRSKYFSHTLGAWNKPFFLFSYLADDDCCIRRCYPGSNLCGHNVEGCQYDSDCESGLSCLPSGFCHDIDECADPNFCGADASCTNSIGSFTCTCNTGFENYVANVGCTDIDECAIGTATNCKLGTDCTNTAGSYTCACKSGYDGDPYVNCYDIDECEVYGMYACDFGDKTGPADMACKNWPGTFQCVDSAILNGGTHGHFYLMTAVNKDHYL